MRKRVLGCFGLLFCLNMPPPSFQSYGCRLASLLSAQSPSWWCDVILSLTYYQSPPWPCSLSILPHLWEALVRKGIHCFVKASFQLTQAEEGQGQAHRLWGKDVFIYHLHPMNTKDLRNLFAYLFNPCALSARGPLRGDHPVHHPRPNSHHPYVRLCSTAFTQHLSGDKPKPVTYQLKPPFLVRIRTRGLAWPT